MVVVIPGDGVPADECGEYTRGARDELEPEVKEATRRKIANSVAELLSWASFMRSASSGV